MIGWILFIVLYLLFVIPVAVFVTRTLISNWHQRSLVLARYWPARMFLGVVFAPLYVLLYFWVES